jgi:hypothetical protein
LNKERRRGREEGKKGITPQATLICQRGEHRNMGVSLSSLHRDLLREPIGSPKDVEAGRRDGNSAVRTMVDRATGGIVDIIDGSGGDEEITSISTDTQRVIA